MVEVMTKRKMPIIGNGAGIWSWIHLDDAASAVVAALDHGERGVYNIVDDDPAPVAVWLPYLAEALGVKAPMRIPTWLARFAVGDAGVQFMTESRGASNKKARHMLGWQPTWTTWRDGFRYGLTDAVAEAA